jgi:hypothetical protein
MAFILFSKVRLLTGGERIGGEGGVGERRGERVETFALMVDWKGIMEKMRESRG